MSKTVGVFLLLLIILVVGVVGIWLYQPALFERSQRETSDAVINSVIFTIGGDGYLGYFFFNSPEIRKLASKIGIRIEFKDDKGAYAERLQKFKEKEYDAIVLPIASYLEHGYRVKFPGVVVMPICDSQGADAILGFTDALSTGNINQDLNDPNLLWVFTPNSPSSFLVDQVRTHFDLFNLTGDTWKKSANGSEDVLEMLKKKEGDIFVMWEPEVSKALKVPGVKLIWDSSKFSGLIIDVLVVHRDYLEKNRKNILKLLNAYYRSMQIYKANEEMLMSHMKKSADLSDQEIQTILHKIDWFDLQEACKYQFGIQSSPDDEVREGLIDAIYSCTDILVNTGVLKEDPIKGDAYILTDKSILEELSKEMVSSAIPVSPNAVRFRPLSEQEWSSLKETATMRVQPITFQTGGYQLDLTGKNNVDQFAGMIENNYPNYWIAIRGHTGPGSDEKANRELSLKRAQAVRQYLIAIHGINPDRLHAEGYGSKVSPPRKPGEAERAYRYRQARVEFVLLEPNL